jgi:large repetitive protein
MEAFVVSTQNVGCGGDCDGIAVYQALGGTPPYNWNILQPLVDNDTGTLDPNPYELDDLCADTAYVVVITDIRGCTDTINFAINEPEPIIINYLLTPPTCTGMFDGGMAVEVSGGTGTLTTVFEPEEVEVVEIDSVTFTVPGLGEGEISITVFDESDCSVVEDIDVIPAIITDMVLTTFSSPESCWNEQDGTATVAVQNGNQPITYQWDDVMEQTTPTAVGLSPNIEYTVIVTDSIGCTLTTSVFVEPTIGCFFMANALTPNGDGVNDVWVVGGLEYFPTANVQVFNRWGQVVFESKGYQSPWEGTYKGEKLPVADYYFLIEYDSSKEPLMGTVTIKY